MFSSLSQIVDSYLPDPRNVVSDNEPATVIADALLADMPFDAKGGDISQAHVREALITRINQLRNGA